MSISNLEQFGQQFTVLLKQEPEWPEILTQGSEMLSELVLNQDWFQPVLSKLVLDEAFLKAQWQSIDPNDIQIYRNPDKLFTVRAFIWEPDVMYPIHDHGAWGIVGAHINQIRERKFARLDDGQNEEYAEVKEIADATLAPGEITHVLPLNDGIHQMQAVDGLTAVTIHVYGAPVRKGFIQYFNPHNNTAHRMYPPSIAKKILAIRTLGSIPETWAEDVLNQALKLPDPDYVHKECQYSLNKLKG
ncbi:MAG: cysteine dioxygenase family protein [Syntrophomonadaceae bacterium]|nr:cysteine dioxygenase family protein [Syntrophomonadaceae bacterium]